MTDARCGMRIGTDGVLLGAWASDTPAALHTVLDVGCGCGLIALMMAQRCPAAHVVALDCEPGALADAAENFATSPWHDRLTLSGCAFENFTSDMRFDMVVSNPPFYTEALHSPDATRSVARHEGTLSFEALATRARELLAPAGRLAVILPADADDRVLSTACINRLYPVRRCRVRTRHNLPYIRTMWEFSLSDGPCEETVLTIRDDAGEYSSQYTLLTHQFHIFM